MDKKHYVRVIYNSGRITTSEFTIKLAAESCAQTMRKLVEEEDMGKVYLYQEGDMPEDCAQSFLAYLGHALYGGVR